MPEKTLVVETFSTFAPLGRFVMRDRSQTIGMGVVIEVTKKQKKSRIAAYRNVICKGDEQRRRTLKDPRNVVECDEYILGDLFNLN